MRTLLLLALVAGLLAGCSTTPRPGPSSMTVPDNTLGDQAMEAGRYKEAIEHYTRWLIDNPDDFTVTFRRAVCLERIGEVDLAIDGYTKALGLRPDHLSARLRRAGVYYLAGQLDNADADLVEVMGSAEFARAEPGAQIIAYGLSGQIALSKGAPQMALDHLDKGIELARKHRGAVSASRYESLVYNRAMGLFGLGAYQMALDDYEEYAAVHQEQGHDLESDDVYHLVLLSYLAGRFDRSKQLLPHLSSNDRRALAAKLADPGFFLSEAEIRMASAAPKK